MPSLHKIRGQQVMVSLGEQSEKETNFFYTIEDDIVELKERLERIEKLVKAIVDKTRI